MTLTQPLRLYLGGAAAILAIGVAAPALAGDDRAPAPTPEHAPELTTPDEDVLLLEEPADDDQGCELQPGEEYEEMPVVSEGEDTAEEGDLVTCADEEADPAEPVPAP